MTIFSIGIISISIYKDMRRTRRITVTATFKFITIMDPRITHDFLISSGYHPVRHRQGIYEWGRIRLSYNGTGTTVMAYLIEEDTTRAHFIRVIHNATDLYDFHLGITGKSLAITHIEPPGEPEDVPF